MMLPGEVEVYVGAQIQYGSERLVLEACLRVLVAEKQSAVLVANAHFGSRQVDLVVATGSRLVVIEAKGYSRPVRGSDNGPWRLETASGHWKEIPNPYRQALEAKFAVRDAMQRTDRKEAPYPAGAVVFVPWKPEGSETYPGDFKVSVVDLDSLKDVVLGANPTWAGASAHLRRVADRLGCTRVSSVAEATDATMAEDGRLMAQYEQALERTYASGEQLIPFECKDRNGKAVLSEAVYRGVVEGDKDTLVLGGSGRGKTMLAHACAVEFARRGGLALVVTVKDYGGDLRKVLNAEAALLGMPSARRVLQACRRLCRSVLLVVDGYNECAESHRAGLTRRLAALARWCEASVLVTSRIPLSRADLLPLETIRVPSTALETKRAIVLEVTRAAEIPANMELLLGSVSSGLEARVIAEIGSEVPSNAGRFRLLDAFARQRMGHQGSAGIGAAAKIAGWLANRVAFSLSMRDLERIQTSEGIEDSVVAGLENGGFLYRRGDRVGFTHENFLDGFVAEAVVRESGGSVDGLLDAIRSPANEGRLDLIIGAIDDHAFLGSFLARLDYPKAIRACLSGACGAPSVEWAEARCIDILGRIREEAEGIRFARVEEGTVDVEFDTKTLVAWDASDRAFLEVLPRIVWLGKHVETVLEAVGTMDRRLFDEAKRIRRESEHQGDELDDRLFERTYVFSGSGQSPGVSMICSAFQSGMIALLEQDAPVPLVELRRLVAMHGDGDGLSSGQLLLVLHLSRWEELSDGFVARGIQKAWSTAPYHLRLRLLEAAQLTVPRTEDSRRRLRQVLENLPNPGPLLGSSLLDALQSLGGFEEAAESHKDVVREEVARCLAEGSEAAAAAWRVYVCQFDHPLASAYWDVVHGLAENDQKKLMVMAAEGAEIGSLFLDTLLVRLCWFGDAKLCGALSRFLNPPPTDAWAPSDAVRAFVTAHIGLARLGCRLPRDDQPLDSRESALGACGSLLYWSNRLDVDNERRLREYRQPLRVLDSPSQVCALDAIRECETAGSPDRLGQPGEPQVVWGIAKEHGKDLVGLCRRALRRPDAQQGCFQHFTEGDKRSCLRLAMDVLGRNGNSVDAALLREFVQDPALGRSAIAALKVLEED